MAVVKFDSMVSWQQTTATPGDRGVAPKWDVFQAINTGFGYMQLQGASTLGDGSGQHAAWDVPPLATYIIGALTFPSGSNPVGEVCMLAFADTGGADRGVQIQVTYDYSDDRVRVYRGNAPRVLLGTSGPGFMALGGLIEAKVTIGGAGSVEVRGGSYNNSIGTIPEVTVINLTGVNTQAYGANIDRVYFGTLTRYEAGTAVYLAHPWVADTTGPTNNDFLGPVVAGATASGYPIPMPTPTFQHAHFVGAHGTWVRAGLEEPDWDFNTGENYIYGSKIPGDVRPWGWGTFTSYVWACKVGEWDSYRYRLSISNTEAPVAVQAYAVMTASAALTNQVQFTYKQGASEVDVGPQRTVTPTVVAGYTQMMNTNPATGLPWAYADLAYVASPTAPYTPEIGVRMVAP